MSQRLDPRPGGWQRFGRSGWLLVALAILAVPCPAAAEPRLHYGGARYLPRDALSDPFSLRKHLYPALKTAGIARIELVAGSESVVQERSPSGMMYLDGLPLQALHGVLMLLPAECAGAEIDLLVEGKGTPGDPDRIWTLRRDLSGGIVVLKGEPPLALDGPDPTPEALSARFGIGALEDSDASWSADERRALEKALELLSPEELEIAAGISFKRARRHPHGRAGSHRPSHLGEPGRITLFDMAFGRVNSTPAYVGPPERAVPYAVFVILHEVGHAVARAERRRLLLQRGDQAESYAESLQAYTRVDTRVDPEDGAFAERRAELEAEMTRTYLDLRRRFEGIAELDARLEELRTGPGSVERRYAELPGALEGPTEYGRTSARESFAESFALQHIDPESLRWMSPQVHAWFAAAAHLQGDEPRLPDVAAPARSQE